MVGVITMNYLNYQESRDMTWKLLIRMGINRLPVRVSEICRALGIRVVSYSQGQALIDRLGLRDNCIDNDGFTDSGIIYYNESCVIGRQRFTVAHELGHILLRHGPSRLNREPAPNDDPKEQAANVFASRLLAPACVLWGIGAQAAKDIAGLCDISLAAAQFRAERMEQLYQREAEFGQKYGRSCFLLSPLECLVYEQFREYIEHNRL